MAEIDALTLELAANAEKLLSLVEEESSPIKSSLSALQSLREAVLDLRDITRALGQYARTDHSLRYIGLMGTFSSGKSSIINSLLGCEARKVDLPPVDDEITILAHSKNRHALMGAHSRGLLKVSVQAVDAPLLERCFIVDTPGSGDPEVRQGMVKDFLPICDVILYVFSATNALGVPDLSILTVLQDHLDFVPIRFVITRCDEFRRDHSLPLSHENLDRARLSDFIGHLMARIRAQAPRLKLEPSNFFVVDNRARYGFDSLAAQISSVLASDIHLHANKLSYFKRIVLAQKQTFEQYIAELDYRRGTARPKGKREQGKI